MAASAGTHPPRSKSDLSEPKKEMQRAFQKIFVGRDEGVGFRAWTGHGAVTRVGRRAGGVAARAVLVPRGSTLWRPGGVWSRPGLGRLPFLAVKQLLVVSLRQLVRLFVLCSLCVCPSIARAQGRPFS
jgi:hypothetical protein